MAKKINYKVIADKINRTITEVHKLATEIYARSPFLVDKDLTKLDLIKSSLKRAKEICDTPYEEINLSPEEEERQTDIEAARWAHDRRNPQNMDTSDINAEIDRLENRFKNEGISKEEAHKILDREDKLKSELEEREAKRKPQEKQHKPLREMSYDELEVEQNLAEIKLEQYPDDSLAKKRLEDINKELDRREDEMKRRRR